MATVYATRFQLTRSSVHQSLSGAADKQQSMCHYELTVDVTQWSDSASHSACSADKKTRSFVTFTDDVELQCAQSCKSLASVCSRHEQLRSPSASIGVVRIFLLEMSCPLSIVKPTIDKRQSQTSHFALGLTPWRVTLSIRPIGRTPFGQIWANMTSSTKGKYVTYCIVIRGELSHCHR